MAVLKRSARKSWRTGRSACFRARTAARFSCGGADRQPDLLLLDEPLANLDMRRESNFVQLINDVVRSAQCHRPAHSRTHNPLLPVLDRVIYVANGHIANGKPSDVLTSKSLTDLYDIPTEY